MMPLISSLPPFMVCGDVDRPISVKLKVNHSSLSVICGSQSNFNTSGVAVEGMGRVGDGTTNVVLLAVEFSIEANPFIKNGVRYPSKSDMNLKELCIM
ncbi:hypothetical protein Tco_0024922 [Tanacetum coccineum]